MEDRFATYSTIAFAAEDAFVRWVTYGENDATWMAWLSRHPHLQPKVDEARKLVLALGKVQPREMSQADHQVLWSRIETSVQAQSPQRVKHHIRTFWTIGLSAAAAIALLIWFGITTSSEKVLAHAGEQKSIVLPEESAVTLNAASTLTYRKKTFEADRVLRLNGEAFFKVKPGSTFTVETDFGNVTVLGTSFNVYSRNGRFEVRCFTGKVKVEIPGQPAVVITPGQLTYTDNDQQSLSQESFIPLKDAPEWTTGRFVFDNQPLSAVIEELERQYDINVRLESGLEDIRYTGLFENGKLDQALFLITWPLHLKSAVKGKTVTISR